MVGLNIAATFFDLNSKEGIEKQKEMCHVLFPPFFNKDFK